jgi:AraC-like DNA-binding protein
LKIVKTYPAYLSREIKLFYSVLAGPDEHKNALHRRLPDGTLDIVFNLSGPVQHSGDGLAFTEMPSISLTGLYHQRRFLSYQGNVHLVGVVFNPGFAHLFLQENLVNHMAATCDASLLFGKPLRQALYEMGELEEEKQKHALLEKLLLARLQRLPHEYQLNSIVLALDKIQQQKGNVNISSLSLEHFLSERHFRRKFVEYVGMAPKKYASIVRIKTFCKSYNREGGAYRKMVEALEYTDKPHLYNDFRKITGTDPTSYFNELHLLGNRFIDLI